MDSKSIPREGVGVRLPSLAPIARDAEPELREVARDLGRTLFPRLRAELAELQRVLREREGGLDVDLEPLTAAQCATRGWGIALGVLAAGEGVDVLGERRTHDALQVLVELVAAARGRALPVAARLPELDAHASGGWEAPLLAGWLLLWARSPEWTLSLLDAELRFEVELERESLPDERRLSKIARALGDRVRWHRERGRLALLLPRAWFARPDSAAD
jgi:hypothetical protein